jgi:hypothetical protein
MRTQKKPYHESHLPFKYKGRTFTEADLNGTQDFDRDGADVFPSGLRPIETHIHGYITLAKTKAGQIFLLDDSRCGPVLLTAKQVHAILVSYCIPEVFHAEMRRAA